METLYFQKFNNSFKKNKESSKDRRIFSMKRNIHKINIIDTIKKNENTSKNIYSLLFGKKEEIQKDIIFKRKYFHKNLKKKYSGKMSEKCEQMISKIYSKINNMKSVSKNLYKINSFSLQKTSNKLFRPSTPNNTIIKNLKYSSTLSTNFHDTSSNRSPSITNNIINRRNNKSEDNYSKSENKFKNLIYVDLPSLYDSLHSKNLNFTRINDNYRNDMNIIFSRYNPSNYIKKLNIIQRDNIEARKTMEKIKRKINIKVIDRCTGKFFKKKYKQIKSAEKRETFSLKKMRILPEKIPFNINFMNNSEKLKILPSGYKLRALYDFSKNKNQMKKTITKKIRIKNKRDSINKLFEKDYELLDNTLEQLFGSLENKPIMNLIDNIEQKKIKDTIDKKNREKIFFPCFNEIDDYFKHFELSKYNNLINENEEQIEKFIKQSEDTLNNNNNYCKNNKNDERKNNDN